MKLYSLRTNHIESPVVDCPPYFSWRIESDENDTLQESYRITVRRGDETVWDSGEVFSRIQSFIDYEGLPLVSCSVYHWRVTVRDNHGNEAEAEETFETAFLSPTEWKAKWMECPFTRISASEYRYGSSYPAVYFERNFEIRKNVSRAVLYITAYGVYRLNVNGVRPDEREFAPEFTSYEKTLYYQTYDVTSLLTEGGNEISVLVGDGWYFSSQAGPVMKERHPEPSVLFQLEIAYEDGMRETVISDESVTCRRSSIVYSDLYQGEKQDFTLPVFDKVAARARNYGYSSLAVQPTEMITAVEKIPAQEIFLTPAGDTVVDFGQVIAGRASVRIDIPRGEEAVFEYFEILDVNGNYLNTMFAPQKDTFVSGGECTEYEAVFTFHGFRYIRVSGKKIIETMKKEDFTAVLLSTKKENCGSFSSSDSRLNRLYRNIRYSQYNNMMSIPTDCPSREKAGWTGDILVYARTAMLNEDMTPFLSSWLRAVRDDQRDNGVITIVSPFMKLYENLLKVQTEKFGDTGIAGVSGWSDAVVWVPYDMYMITGNRRVLCDNYKAMKKWAEYIIRTASTRRGESGIPLEYDQYLWNTGFHFGEWLVPSRPLKEGEGPYDACVETSYYTAPFFGYMTTRKLSRIASLLGETEDERRYDEIGRKMKWAIQNGIMRRGGMPEKYMGAYILAFAFDLVPDDLKEEYRDRLVSLLEANGLRLDTGFLATPFILDVLYTLGRKDLAYRILFNTSRPSWLYEVENGATAIWESWDADDARSNARFVSFDHYAFGSVDDFICRRICGIDSDTPGFSHILIAPDTDSCLSFSKREFISEAGAVTVEWNKDTLKVSIPPNTTADIFWKGRKHEVGSGNYSFGE